MWLTKDQIKKAQNVIDVYGEDTVAGRFAKEILELSSSTNLFGDFSMPLSSTKIPSIIHPVDYDIIEDHLGNYNIIRKKSNEE